MKYWLTDGVFHRENTLRKDFYANNEKIYEDTGISYEIPDDSELVVIPEGTREIGYEAFAGFPTSYKNRKPIWQNLKKVILPDSVIRICDDAFHFVENLAEINLPEGIEFIGGSVFSETSISSIILPESTQEVGMHCFGYCKKLTKLVFPKSPTKISVDAFPFCPKLETVDIPSYVNKIMDYLGCSALKSVLIPEGTQEIHYHNFEDCESLKSIDIPNGVTIISGEAFKNCRSLENVTIPDSVTEIGNNAFENCESLKQIVIPAKARKVGSDAFKGCTGLESIHFQYAFKGFEAAFQNSKNVKQIYISQGSLGKAKAAFPLAEIHDQNGRLLYSPSINETNSESKTDGITAMSKSAYDVASVAKVQVLQFKKTEYQVKQGKRVFHVVFSGAAMLNRTIKKHLANRDSKDTDNLLFDAEDLKQSNSTNLYVIDPHTGVQMEGLSKDARYLFSPLNLPPAFNDPLSSSAIEKRTVKFSESVSKCLADAAIQRIIDYVPHKKDGSFYKGRTTLIVKDTISDIEGKVCVLYAKNITDNEMELNAKKVYLGDKLLEESEAARVIGLLKSAEQERAERLEQKKKEIQNDPFGYSLKGSGPVARYERDFNEKYAKYMSKNPKIEFQGKVFVFSNMLTHEEGVEEPIVKAIIARGAEYKNRVTGKTNYLVTESIKTVGEGKMKEAVKWIEKGKDLQVITAKDLINALKKA